MDKKIIVLTLVFFVLLGVQEAKAELPNNTFEENEEVNVFVQCIMLNNSVCDPSTNCTMTALYPNTSLLVQSVEMTPNLTIGFYNYSFGVLTDRGIYSSTITCRGIEEGVIPYSFSVGDIDEAFDETFWFYMSLILIPLALGILAWKTEDKLFLIMAGFVLCTFAFIIFNQGFPGLNNDFIRNSMTIVIAGLGFYLIAKNGYDLTMEVNW